MRAAALVGATASGKSALAHSLARRRGDVEILVVDSMTVYRGMDIATAKPSAAERAEAPYHLIDLIEPNEEFAVAPYQRAARAAADAVVRAGHGVLYVGGTGLYGRVILDDLEIPGRYPQIAAELAERVTSEREALYAQLVALDPVGAARVEPSNDRRLVRALEVCLGSGRPFSSFGPGLTTYPDTGVTQVGLTVKLSELDRRIEERFHAFVAAGLVEEVANLAARGLSRTARQAVGYREILEHVEHGADLEACVEAAILQTRRLARRQLRWFRRDPRIEWFDEPAAAEARLDQALR